MGLFATHGFSGARDIPERYHAFFSRQLWVGGAAHF
jgi:hypothetical protein